MKHTDDTIARFHERFRFSREWHVAHFDPACYEEVRQWCEEQFGCKPDLTGRDAWTRWRIGRPDKVSFRDKVDYVLFVLKWA